MTIKSKFSCAAMAALLSISFAYSAQAAGTGSEQASGIISDKTLPGDGASDPDAAASGAMEPPAGATTPVATDRNMDIINDGTTPVDATGTLHKSAKQN